MPVYQEVLARVKRNVGEASYIPASEGSCTPTKGPCRPLGSSLFANKACFQTDILVFIVIEEDPIALMSDFSEEGY